VYIVENTQSNKKVLKIVGNVVFWVLLVVVVFYSAVTLFSKREENMTSVFGMSALSVQSDSMAPTFKEGALVFIKTDYDVDELIADFQNDEKIVITFRVVDGTDVYYNTHTVINYQEVGGIDWFTTRGDGAPEDKTETILGTEIIGVWTGSHLPGAGFFIDFLQSSVGFLLFIVLPCLAFLVYEIIRFTKIYSQYQVQKTMADRVKMQEDAVAQAKIEWEKDQQANKTELPDK
jgi:signal peptidase